MMIRFASVQPVLQPAVPYRGKQRQRPPFTDEQAAALTDHFATGGLLGNAHARLGVTTTIINFWRHNDDRFKALLEAARPKGNQSRAAKSLVKRGETVALKRKTVQDSVEALPTVAALPAPLRDRLVALALLPVTTRKKRENKDALTSLMRDISAHSGKPVYDSQAIWAQARDTAWPARVFLPATSGRRVNKKPVKAEDKR